MRKAVLFILIFLPAVVSAQLAVKKSGLSAGGGVAANGTMQLVWSVGEVSHREAPAGSYLLSEGFVGALPQQTASAVREYGTLTGIRAWPNPVTDVLQIGFAEGGTYRLSLIDLTGKKVLKKQINGNHTTLRVSSLTQSIYLLLIVDEKHKMKKVFRIEKQ